MKILISILAMVLGVVAYFTLAGKSTTTEESQPVAASNVPIWEQPIPDGTKLVTEGLARINVKLVRRDEGNRNWMDFHITEEHGYMVDGITIRFWYQFKDEESGDLIADTHTVDYFVKNRLEPNATLVESTPLLDIEFSHLGTAMPVSTSDNWVAQVVAFSRAMEPASD